MRLILGLSAVVPGLVAAQTLEDSTTQAVVWQMATGGDQEQLRASTRSSARDSALVRLQKAGHYFAQIDSVVADSAAGAGTVYLTPGPRYVLGELVLEGTQVLDQAALLRLMDTRPGRVLDPVVLEADIGRMLRQYERTGHLLAQVEIVEVELMEDFDSALRLRLRVWEGPAPVLAGLEVEGENRTRTTYLARAAGVRPGRPLRNYRPDELRRRLQSTGFYRSVGEPRIRLRPDSTAILIFPLDEHAPGTFDLVLGFLPPSGGDERLSVVGNGHLELNNLFGAGRSLALRLNRLPDQASTVQVRLADPFILGLPLSIEAQFDGLQQDSAYTKQRYGAEVGVRLALTTQGFVTIGREVTRPGVAVTRSVGRADAWFFGVGVRMRRVDQPLLPTRGYVLEAVAESGRKNRTGTTSALPVDQVATTTDQDRLRLAARLYHPVRTRQILALGLDAAAVLRGIGDESDLLRFGGATTLRGYDEDRFLARTAARGLVEYRYLLDRESFAFGFFDLGFVDTPGLAGVEAQRGFYPGYGIGMQFSTGVGVVSASYAISSEAGPTNGRIHVGLSFGL